MIYEEHKLEDPLPEGWIVMYRCKTCGSLHEPLSPTLCKCDNLERIRIKKPF
jgi:uncharacterized OB-fold protein